jgi:hypothetical protein
MSNATGGPLARLRQPEYTGENRCIPCTAANVVIAAVVAVVAGVVWWPAGLAAFALSLGAIWLRGYLVPGTPELTKRYFPDWLLAMFDKRESATGVAAAESDGEDEYDEPLDVEEVLLESGVLRVRDDQDLEVTPAFAEDWRAEIEHAREHDTGRETLAELVGFDPEDISFDDYGDAFIATQDGTHVGRWESEAAFLADVGAARAVESHIDDWERYGAYDRGQLLSGLRLFVEECPDCGGPVRFGQEVVQSCCRSVDVVAVTCENCEARLFEMDAPDGMVA